MDNAELLAQLADIHLPDAVGLWPPAPGWWLLAALLLAVLFFGGRRLSADWRRRRFRAHALAEVDRLHGELAEAAAADFAAAQLRFVNSLSSVLRRVALTHFPSGAVAGLGGDDWIRFLRANGDCAGLDSELATLLSRDRFRPATKVDSGKLLDFGRGWIRSVYSRRPKGFKASWKELRRSA